MSFILALTVFEPLVRADVGAADTLFRAARAASKRGDEGQACKLFAESYRLESAIGTELNLAVCEERDRHFAHALQMFQEVYTETADSDPRHALAADRIHEVEQRVAWVTLKADVTLPKDTTIAIGDVKLTEAGLNVKLPLDPGKKTIAIRAPGHQPHEMEIDLAEAADVTLAVELGRPIQAPRATVTAPPPPATGSNTRRVAAVTALGVSASLLMVTGALGLAVIQAKADVNENCDGTFCSPEGVRLAQRGRALSLASDLTFAASICSAGLAALLLLGPTKANARQAASRFQRPSFGLGPNRISLRLTF